MTHLRTSAAVYDLSNTRTVNTVRFICREKWECPLCGAMTKISYVKCSACKRDMGINKYQFEIRLKRVCPTEIFDNHKIAA
jgi:hypothetical protein